MLEMLSRFHTSKIKPFFVMIALAIGGETVMGQQINNPTETVTHKSDSRMDSIDKIALVLQGSGESLPNVLIPREYFDLIHFQNGAGQFVHTSIARKLFANGRTNIFNKIRALYIIKPCDDNILEERLWNGIKHSDDWKKFIHRTSQDEFIVEFVNKTIVNKIEAKLLKNHAGMALNGSMIDASKLWHYYYKPEKFNNEIGFGWFEVCYNYFQGFPGPTDFSKCMYWLTIAAENGDAEAQMRLGQYHDINDPLSRVRSAFWLKKAADAGIAESRTTFEMVIKMISIDCLPKW